MSSVDQPPNDAPAVDFLAGGGDMGALMRAHDWLSTPLGGVEGWPQSLRTAVSILVNSRYPMFIAWGPELAFLYNDGYRPIFGAKHPAALGRPFAEIWAEIWEDIRPLVDRALAGKGTWSDDLRLFMERSGYLEETYFTFSYSRIRDESGGVGGMFCACTETTGKVLGERRLHCLRDLAALTAQAKTVEEADRLCMQVLGASRVDLPFALLYRQQESGPAKLVGSANVAGGAPTAPLTLGTRSGIWPLAWAMRGKAKTVDDLPTRFAEVPSSEWGDPVQTALVLPIPDRGHRASATTLVLGVNPRRELDEDYRSFIDLVAASVATTLANARAFEEERSRAEALAELDQAKTAFFSNVSHEFRTPLTLMLGPLEETLARPSITGIDKQQLAISHRNGLRLLKLVNSLLDFSRVEAGRVHAAYRATDLATFTADLASSFRSACERAGLRLSIDCPPLPEPVHVDRDMWEKIVLNLVSNAFKFTFEGAIEVELRAQGDQAELTVRDTGIGVSKSELPRIFDRFHRVESAQGRTREGAGIGLALVQELVRLHGGSVGVASTEGRGTTFTVRVPFGTAHLQAERIAASGDDARGGMRVDAYVEEALRWLPGEVELTAPDIAPSVPQPVESGAARALVLVADDNADMRDYLQRLLSPHYDVEALVDGEAALAAISARRPDLVLCDVMMPRLDGFGLLKALRANPEWHELPVILLSARAGEEARIEGLKVGADDYLIKPFSARELLARVQAHLDMAALRRQNETRLRMLIDELNHRVKNTLATVQSIAAQVLRSAGVAPDVSDAIESRLFSLARSHDLLAIERWETASLRDVAVQALEPFGSADDGANRLSIDGEDVRLRPKTALALGMAFHELATNAGKYGALSNTEGNVRIVWTVASGRLRLRWQESGGPVVERPLRKGFGSLLIERGLASELDGTVHLTYVPTGVVCDIEMPAPCRREDA